MTSPSGDNRLPPLAELIRLSDGHTKRSALALARVAIEIGNALIEAKALVSHRGWRAWLSGYCAMSPRAAQRYMSIARSGMKPATVALFGVAAAAATLERLAARHEFVEFRGGGLDHLAEGIRDPWLRLTFAEQVTDSKNVGETLSVLLTEKARQARLAVRRSQAARRKAGSAS